MSISYRYSIDKSYKSHGPSPGPRAIRKAKTHPNGLAASKMSVGITKFPYGFHGP